MKLHENRLDSGQWHSIGNATLISFPIAVRAVYLEDVLCDEAAALREIDPTVMR